MNASGHRPGDGTFRLPERRFVNESCDRFLDADIFQPGRRARPLSIGWICMELIQVGVFPDFLQALLPPDPIVERVLWSSRSVCSQE